MPGFSEVDKVYIVVNLVVFIDNLDIEVGYLFYAISVYPNASELV